LEKAGVSVGVVNSIVGRKSYRVRFQGQTGHAGTASMIERRDALQGAALFITRAHELVRTQFPEGVLNCGDLQVRPGSMTTIPGEANVIVETRHVDEGHLAQMEAALQILAQECAVAAHVDVNFVCTNHIPAAQMDEGVTEAIEQACEIIGVSHLRLPSYASHNAQVLSTFTPSGMFFIPSINGLSHNPEEFSRWEDIVNGTNVLLHAIIHLAINLP
ncbi:MAG: M20/M25/M40 family metallo-hydrolase, partial [Anaerolineae bacterium]|nr:M20/M25/M40 family metallo-hydrolase [Anaerolineae bacterium]